MAPKNLLEWIAGTGLPPPRREVLQLSSAPQSPQSLLVSPPLQYLPTPETPNPEELLGSPAPPPPPPKIPLTENTNLAVVTVNISIESDESDKSDSSTSTASYESSGPLEMSGKSRRVRF